MVTIIRPLSLVTLDVLYYIPQTLILNQFIWQLEDRLPELARSHKFLRFWKTDIDAVIKEVRISSIDGTINSFTAVDLISKLS